MLPFFIETWPLELFCCSLCYIYSPILCKKLKGKGKDPEKEYIPPVSLASLSGKAEDPCLD